VLGLSLETGAQLREDALTEYSLKTGIELDLIPTPGTSAEQLPLVLDLLRKRATSPDIYLIDGTWPGTLHEHLTDLNPHLNEESRGHAESLLANNTVEGRLIALPFYMNGGMLLYRIDLLEKYGYADPPQTWEELARMARRIQDGERKEGKRSFWGYVWQGGSYEGLMCNALEWQASSGGGPLVGTDGSIGLDNPQTNGAMRMAAGWIGTISPRSVLAYTESDSSNVFRSGNAAFMRHWSSAFRGIRDSMVSGSAGVALLPAGAAGRAHTIGGFQLAVSKYSQHQREAIDLVLYLTGKDVQLRRALRRGYLPTYPELHQGQELQKTLPQARVFGEARETWVFRPSSIVGEKYTELSEAYIENVHEILSGNVSSERAIAEIRQKLTILTGVPTGLSQH
jgi:trehalose/maltose transport system substrate-binding protein